MLKIKLRRNCWYGPQVSRLRQCRRWENRQLSQRWTLSMQPEYNICGILLSKWKWSSLWKRVNIFSPNANWQNTKYLWYGGSPGGGHEGQGSNLDSNWCWKRGADNKMVNLFRRRFFCPLISWDLKFYLDLKIRRGQMLWSQLLVKIKLPEIYVIVL